MSNPFARYFVKKSFILRGIDEIFSGPHSRAKALIDLQAGSSLPEILEREIGNIPAQVVAAMFFGEDPKNSYWPKVPYKVAIATEAYKFAHSFDKPVYTYLVRIHDADDFTIQVTEEQSHVTVHILTSHTINDPNPPDLNDEERSWVFGSSSSIKRIVDFFDSITKGRRGPLSTDHDDVKKVQVFDYKPEID